MVATKIIQTDANTMPISSHIAQRYVGNRDRTYLGYITREGIDYAAAYDHRTRTLQTFPLLATGWGDDHSIPVVCVLNDGNIRYFYCKENLSPMYSRVTATPEDITTLGDQQPISSSQAIIYPYPVYCAPIIVLFYRNNSWIDGNNIQDTYVCVISKDNGETWSAEFPVYQNVNCFQVTFGARLRYSSDPFPASGIADIIASTNAWGTAYRPCTDHNIYYAYLEIDGPDSIYIKSVTGAVLMDLNNPGAPITPDQLFMVEDGSTNQVGVAGVMAKLPYVYIYYTLGTSTKCLLYNTETITVDNHVVICNGNGAVWSGSGVATSSAMVVVDGDADTVYVSLVASPFNTWPQVYEMWKYASQDNGATWEGTNITGDSSMSESINIHPICPLNAHPNMPVYWSTGTVYNAFYDWQTSLAMIDDTPTPPPADETEELTATISTNQNITVPIGWNA